MSEIARLRAYCGTFDEGILEVVDRVASHQRRSTWGAVKSQLPDTRIFTPLTGKPVEVLDIIPDDYEATCVYHLPMGNTIDDTTVARLAAFAEAEPTKRVIATGNPGPIGHSSGKLRWRDLPNVWNGDLRPAVEPTLQYLDHKGIETSTHIGLSYGADRAAAASQYAHKYDQQVQHGVFIEPSSVTPRSLFKLATDFSATAEALEGYIQAVACRSYNEARRLAGEQMHGKVGYLLGLGRLSNLAIAHALALNGFEKRTSAGLNAQKEMDVSIIWGSKSELAIHGLMRAIVDRLQDNFGSDRVLATVLQDQRHALGDDIFLHTALILQSTRTNN